MQITSTLLNIPPYISTTWEHVASLRTEKNQLVISLKNGDTTIVPGLDLFALNKIFDAHANFLEKKSFTFSIPVKPSQAGEFGAFAAMNHIPEDSTLPNIPADLLEKIVILTQSISGGLAEIVEPYDSTCNCTFCQIARHIKYKVANLDEELIDDNDLTFRDWEIAEVDAKLYTVTSPLDANEQYRVFLGEPLGCTCGENHCEHIKAVLET
jgi:hypothetical protein